ncbi:MAG TPA: hypothetical protein VNB22_19135 [Pyrinomonadaceae bacterium]|jgi:DNA-directed RNA polymerase specialized sigma24 family protein|nr:hypothetical protein [Pyrinomonadaceae bacterium]
MATKVEINQDNFAKLLDWLHPDADTAGKIYESVRNRLIKIFYARGSCIAEELADETIDRVVGKIKWLSEHYEGEPFLFFYGVAKKVFLEYSKKPKLQELPATLIKENAASENSEIYYECLDRCLAKMLPAQQELILEYYQGEKQAKIKQRKLMEARLGISNQTLRVRILRLRETIQKCVRNCVEKNFC